MSKYSLVFTGTQFGYSKTSPNNMTINHMEESVPPTVVVRGTSPPCVQCVNGGYTDSSGVPWASDGRVSLRSEEREVLTETDEKSFGLRSEMVTVYRMERKFRIERHGILE